ncbi:hypothetical protein ATANTOWER_019778 [Ataeniobius toweri]|uniref:Uncharacterized protein n=1 Tax=Ataeniobius toweri TaxID=208326 RepID=A0ABU7ASE7_9TELE|nr:hypothetical protein [Ataeniobius toweri]
MFTTPRGCLPDKVLCGCSQLLVQPQNKVPHGFSHVPGGLHIFGAAPVGLQGSCAAIASLQGSCNAITSLQGSCTAVAGIMMFMPSRDDLWLAHLNSMPAWDT